MLNDIDETLKRTGEEKLKLREGSWVDCNVNMTERYNKGRIGYKRLCELSKRVKDSLQELVRQHAFKVEAIREAIKIEKVHMSSKLVKEENYPKAIYTEWKSPHYSERWCCTRMLNSIEYNWKIYAIPCLSTILAIFATLLSLVVIALEVGLYFNYQEVNLFKWWTEYSHNNPQGSFFVANGLCLLPLTYMCLAGFYGMFRVKINAIFALHDKQMTDPVSLAYSGLLLTRLAIAVSYNYLEISDVQGSAFFTVMGPMNNIEFLGENFNKWVFPSLMFLTIFLTVTDCCSRILNCVGLKQYAFD